MRLTKAIILLVFVWCAVGCGNQKPGNRIVVVNKLGRNVVCVLGYNYPNLDLNYIGGVEKLMLQADKYEVDMGQQKAIDTLGLCDSVTWNKTIKNSMLELFVFDKDKLNPSTRLEDALTERYYFTYTQIKKLNGVITLQ